MHKQSPSKLWRRQRRIRDDLNKEGVIITWTMIYVPGSDFVGEAPFPVVMVDLGRKRIVAQLVDYQQEHLKQGQKVKVVLRRTKQTHDEDLVVYGNKVRPVL